MVGDSNTDACTAFAASWGANDDVVELGDSFDVDFVIDFGGDDEDDKKEVINEGFIADDLSWNCLDLSLI